MIANMSPKTCVMVGRSTKVSPSTRNSRELLVLLITPAEFMFIVATEPLRLCP